MQVERENSEGSLPSFQNFSIQDQFESKGKDNVLVETKSLQKGRFTIESTSPDIILKETQSCKKGRFLVEMVDDNKIEIDEHKESLEILEIYNQQMEVLFDMVKNLAGEDKLFQKEFIELSSKAYEKLEIIKRNALNR